jgi:O-antigen ligase
MNWSPVAQRTRALWAGLGAAGQLIASVLTSLALLAGMLLTWGDSLPNVLRREPVQVGVALLSAGLAYLSPGFVLTVLAVFVLFWIVYQRLDLGLALIVFFAPFFLFPVELWRFAFPMAELVLLITAAAWLLRGLVAWGINRQAGLHTVRLPRRLWAGCWVDLAVGVFVAAGALALLWSANRADAITEFRTLFVQPALFYAMLRTVRLERTGWHLLFDALLAAALMVCAVGLFNYVRGENVITAEGGARRLASMYGSPNNVALLIERALPFALALALLPAARTRRIGAAAACALLLATLVLTQSAGGLFFGLPVGVAIVLLAVYGRRALLPLLGLAVIGALALSVLAGSSARFGRLFDFQDGTSFLRLRVWQSAIAMLEDRPFTGLGLDQFLYAYRDTYILPDAWQEPDLSHPHNLLLDFWTRLGVPGLLAGSLLLASFWQAIWRAYHGLRTAPPRWRALVIGTMGAVGAALAHGLIDNSIFVLDLALFAMLFLAFAATQLQSLHSAHDDRA